MADPDPGHVGYGIVAARLKQAETDSRSFTDFTDSHDNFSLTDMRPPRNTRADANEVT